MPDRRGRGAKTQALVAEWYQRLWPAATSAGSGASGRDILNVPLDIEVKGRREFRPLEWVRQLRKREQVADDLPGHVVMRPDGLGEAHIGDWLVIRPLAEDTEILAELLKLRAQAEGGDDLVRRILEAVCARDEVPLDSAVVPGESARNYELAMRLGIGHVFGVNSNA